MSSLELAVQRLLFKRSYYRAFIDARYHIFALSDEDLADMASIDHDELARARTRIRENLVRQRHAGSGGLVDCYPRTIEAWRTLHTADAELSELMDDFMESEPFDAYREVPFADPGLSLEEAFFRFCDARNIGDPVVLEREFLAAMMRALVVSPSANFTLPACVRQAPGGYFAISARGAPVLYAALGGRFLTGPITPFLAELLAPTSTVEVIRERHGVTPLVLEAALTRFAELGLHSNGHFR